MIDIDNVYNNNEILSHKKYGKGKIIKIDGNYIIVEFESVGNKVFQKDAFLHDYFKKI